MKGYKIGVWDDTFRLNWGFEHCEEAVTTDWQVTWHCCGRCGQLFRKPNKRKTWKEHADE